MRLYALLKLDATRLLASTASKRHYNITQPQSSIVDFMLASYYCLDGDAL